MRHQLPWQHLGHAIELCLQVPGLRESHCCTQPTAFTASATLYLLPGLFGLCSINLSLPLQLLLFCLSFRIEQEVSLSLRLLCCRHTGAQLPQQGCNRWPEAAPSRCGMEADENSSRPCSVTGWLNIAASAGLCQVAKSCCFLTQQQCEAPIQKQQPVLCCRQTGYTSDERPEAAQ